MTTLMTEPFPENPAVVEFKALRQWVIDAFPEHPVRMSHLNMALSTVVHRLLKFGPDEALNEFDCLDLLRLLPFVNGPHAEWVITTAFTRAIIEDRRDVIDRFGHLRYLIPGALVWFHGLITALYGAQTDPDGALKAVESLEGEERDVARLLMGRIYPGSVKVGWLDESVAVPRLQAALCRVVAGNPLYTRFVEEWVRQRPDVRNEALAS